MRYRFAMLAGLLPLCIAATASAESPSDKMPAETHPCQYRACAMQMNPVSPPGLVIPVTPSRQGQDLYRLGRFGNNLLNPQPLPPKALVKTPY